MKNEVWNLLIILAAWYMLDLEQPTLQGFLFMVYATILAWTELMPRSEQALQRIEEFLQERLSKPI